MSNDKCDEKFSKDVNSFGDRPCGCKGIRTCLICENLTVKRSNFIKNANQQTKIVYNYCSQCGSKAWLKDDLQTHLDDESYHLQHSSMETSITGSFEFSTKSNQLPKFIPIQGITVIKNVIGEDEEKLIVSLIDDPATPSPWVSSQSGRRKQDYGPKVNFRKQKVKLNGFNGLPDYGHKLFRHVQKSAKVLENFIPVELCNLEYVPERGSAIDPHLDDDWLWGERLVTVNLISETRLTLSPVECSHKDIDEQSDYDENNFDHSNYNVEIEISLPARSLLVLYGDARYKWYHAIKREHIISRRIGITIRELTPIFLPEGQLYQSIGKQILSIASEELSCKLNNSESHIRCGIRDGIEMQTKSTD